MMQVQVNKTINNILDVFIKYIIPQYYSISYQVIKLHTSAASMLAGKIELSLSTSKSTPFMSSALISMSELIELALLISAIRILANSTNENCTDYIYVRYVRLLLVAETSENI